MGKKQSSLIAGACAGVAGLLAFLIVHMLWIKPIWFIAPAGLVIAIIGGLAVGWSYSELLPRLPGRPWAIPAWIALVSLILAPAVILAQLRPPMFTMNGMQATVTITTQQAIVILARDLLLTSTVTGALLGWLIGRTRRAALATALAGFIFALGPGHNIPFLGNTPVTGKGITLLLSAIVPASIVLVEVQAALAEKNYTPATPRLDERGLE